VAFSGQRFHIQKELETATRRATGRWHDDDWYAQPLIELACDTRGSVTQRQATGATDDV